MKKFLFFCGLVVFMTVLLTMPAAAMCDECVNSEDQITEDHCEGRCNCYYEECWGCGDETNLVYCGLNHYYGGEVYIPPTCEEDGYFGYECVYCDHVDVVEIEEKIGHDYKDGFCCECGAKDPSYVPHTHSYSTAVTPPTCTAEGFTVYTCACGHSYKSYYTEIIPHNYVDGLCSNCDKEDPYYEPPHTHNYASSVTAPTCTAGGYTTYTCACGDSYTGETTDALGHSFTNGKCSECSVADPDYEPPHTHNYQSSVTPPTCTSGGYTTHTCSECGDTYTSNRTDPTGHSYQDGECTECGASDPNYTPPHTHNYSSAVTPPTCTAEGFTVYTCACGHSYKSHYTEVISHNYVDGLCTVCDKVDPSLNPPHGHTYTAVVTAPTCHSKGFTTYTCSCGNTYVDNYVDEIPHLFVQQEKVEPKCGVEGHIYSVCNYNCGEERYEPIAALIHNWSIIGTEVFEDGTGIATYECTRCEERKTETVYSEATLAENWLLTAIRGFADAFIDIYQTVANGFQIGGITLGQVISGALIVFVLLLLMAFALKILG